MFLLFYPCSTPVLSYHSVNFFKSLCIHTYIYMFGIFNTFFDYSYDDNESPMEYSAGKKNQ